MYVLKRWRFHMSDDGSFILTGIGRYDRFVRIPVKQDNIQYAKLDTSYLQLNLKDKLELPVYFKE